MKYKNLIMLTTLFLFSVQLSKAESETPISDTLLEGSPKIYIDCPSCDDDYIRREITLVNFVRDRNQADIHILVSRQRTGSDGREYMVEFIGQHEFANMTDTLTFNTKEAETNDAIRERTVKYLKLGLTRFITRTPLSKYVSVTFTKPTKQAEVNDKWNSWVFDIGGNFWINGDENYRSMNLWNNFGAKRVTENLKIEFGLYWNYNDQKFTNEASYDLYINRSKGTNAEFVLSLNEKWSVAYGYNFFSSTFANKDLDFSNEVGIEYNIFPYTESSRRAWIIRYVFGVTYIDYTERTVYDKIHEWLTYSKLESSIKFSQPWGSAYSSLNGVVYFHDFDRNRLTFSSGMSVNLFEGFSVNFSGNYSRVRDQLSLSGAGDSETDILLRRKELASGYNYWFSFGLSYSFGSIYNNIVNPRF